MSAGREPHISESRDLWTREHSRDRVVLTRFATPAPEPVRHRAEIAMLAWHGQEHRIASAAARRFLGIVGNGHAHVSAFAVCSAVAPDALSLIIFNARPDTGPRVLADLAIGDVQPVVASTLIPDDAVLHDDVTARIAAVDSVAFIQSIQPDQLVALGFTAPVLRDHALTGFTLRAFARSRWATRGRWASTLLTPSLPCAMISWRTVVARSTGIRACIVLTLRRRLMNAVRLSCSVLPCW